MSQTVTPPAQRRCEIPDLPALQAPPGWSQIDREDGVRVMAHPAGLTVLGCDAVSGGARLRTLMVKGPDGLYPTSEEVEVVRAWFFGDALVAIHAGLVPGTTKALFTMGHSPDWPEEQRADIARRSLQAMEVMRQAEKARGQAEFFAPIATPPGWEKTKHPTSGHPVYHHKGLRVVVSEHETDGRMRRMVSISHGAGRPPKPREVDLVRKAFLHDGLCSGPVGLDQSKVEGLKAELVYLVRDRRTDEQRPEPN